MARRLPDAKSLQCQMVTVAIGGRYISASYARKR